MKERHQLKRRLLSFVLTFVMLFGTVIEPIQVSAAQPGTGTEAALENTPMLLAEEPEVDPTETPTISLNTQELALEVGDTSTLTAAVVPAGAAVTWVSGNNEIAEVTGNNVSATVKAVAVGSTDITASFENNETTYTAKATVTVSTKMYNISMAVSANKEEIDGATVYIGDKQADRVAKGVYATKCATGTYNVTATKPGFKDYNGNVIVSTEDVWKDIPMSLNDVNVTIEGNTTLTVSDTTKLSAAIPDFEGNQEVTWSSSDEKIVTVDSGVVTAVKKGTATIKATVNTDFGTVSKDTVFTVSQAANTSVAIAVNPAGGDKIEQVDITATVTNTKNNKVVTKGKICFTISKLSADGSWDEVQKETIDVDKNGSTVYSVKDTTDFGLIGKYKFKADYSDGNNEEFYISSSSSETISEDYKNVIPMKFVDKNDQEITIDSQNPQEVTYGDTGYQIKVNHDSFVETAEDIEKTDSVAYTYKVKSDGISEKVLSVDEEGNVSFLRAYDDNDDATKEVVYVEVTRDGIGNHAGITVDYPITVKRKTLTIDTSCKDVTYSKIYDKTSDVFHNEDTKDILSNLEKIPLEGLVTPPNGTVEDKVTVKDAKGTTPAEIIDAGKYDDVEVQYSEIVLDGDETEDGYNLKDNYRLEVSAEKPITLKTQVTIEKRVVKLKVSDGQRQYGHYDDGVTFTGDPVSENTEVYTKRDIEGIVGNDTVVYPTPVEVTITNVPDYALGSYPDKLTVYPKTATGADNGDAGNNYYFDFDNVLKGTLEVVKEEINESNYRDYVDFPEDGGSVYLSKTEDKVWVNNNLTAFHMIPKSGTNYTDVYLANAQGEPDYSISSGNGIDITKLPSEEMDGATATIKVCMYNTNNGSASEPFDVKLFLDKLDPIVSKTSISEETHGLKSFGNAITFGLFYNEFKDSVETVIVSDGSGSGIQRWDYNIMTGGSDEDFSKEKIEAYTAATSDQCTWNEMAVRKDNEDNAALEGTITLPKEENNYVLLLKLKDNVGNEEIYASNGVIIDYQAPTVSIDLAREPIKEGEPGQFESTTGIYGEDVRLKIHVEDVVSDVNESKSAISKVDIKVVKDNDESTSTSVTLLDITTENAEEPDKPKTAWTLLDLDSYRSKDLYYTVNAKDYNSNNVTVTATVTDNAGNENSYTYALKIDTTPPIITADYTTDANGKKGSEPKNGYYYKDPMYAFITYTERNFDKTESYLWFEVQVEGREIGNYSVEKLTSELGIQTAWLELETSQDDQDDKNFTDERQHKLMLTFDRDDHYTFTPYMKDLAEKADSNNDPIASNEVASGDTQHFVVDRKAPIMHVVYEDADGKPMSIPQESEKRVYNGKGVRAIVTIDEHNFAIEKDGVQVDVNVKASEVEQDAKGNDIALQDYNGTLKQYSAWNPQNVDTYTSTYYFGVDANYTHSITYTDLAGNEVSYDPGYFTVDKTKPTGTVKVGTLGWWDKFLEKISFGLFSATTVDVEMTGDDHTSPVRPVQYARFRNGKTKAELETYNGWSSASAETPEKAGFKVNPDEQFVVYTRVTDYAGNYEYFSSDGIIVDHTKPAPIVTVTNLSQAQNGIFNEDVTLRIDAEDPTAGDTYSGLEKVWYTVSASGNVVKSETITLMDNSDNRVQGNKTFSQIITVKAADYNSNDVKVQAFATDFSGNQGDSEVTNLKIDVTAPTISVVWDLNSPLNNRYYKDTRTATVTVTDRNFDPNAVRFSITNTDGTPASIGGWSSSSNIGVSDSATTTCQVSFPADGDYTFTFGCTDLAGNSAEYGKTDEFTIDKTLPVMTVSYDNNSAKNGNYYKEARTATVTIREHNFNAADVRAAITASLEGSGIAAPSISGFSTSGDTHTATVKYDTDGDYTFDVDYTDMAGNQAADYAMDDFTVDLTAPEVDIIDIVDKSANNDTVSPAVNATDINYDMRNVTVSVIGTNNGTVEIGKVTTTIENGQNIKLNDFARTEAMDDLYKLTAKAVDLAGNETEDSVLFSVNRYGSVFVLDDSTNKEKSGWLSTKEDDYTYINQEREVGVIEYNVDTIESSKITVNRDGELANLEKGTDYTVTASGSEVQWKETHYVMNADNFAEEGNYTVILNTQDRASNSVNNSSVKKSTGALPIAFTVDKTAPSIVISGIENNEQYREAEKKFTVDAKDNLALKEVKVAVNDEETVYRAEDLRNAEGIIDVIEMTVGKSNSWQKIKVSASDMAGNVKEYRPLDKNGEEIEDAAMAFVSILVTPNILVQYYANKPVFYSSVAILAVLAALIIFIIWKKKKEDEEKSQARK